MRPLLRLLAAAPLLAAFPAAAAPQLLATGTLSLADDLSGLNNTLENGNRASIFGGIGSGLAWAGGSTFVAVPDRGPNAASYSAAVDNTTSYVSRFHTLNLALAPSSPGAATPFSLAPQLSATTLLYSPTPLAYGSGAGLFRDGTTTSVGSGVPSQNGAGHYYFTGRSDGFDPARNSLDPNNARLDPEGVRVSPDGRSVFVSDEYGPYVYQFDRATGQRVRSFALPSDPGSPGNLAATNLSPQGSAETSGNTTGRAPNRGLEGLAITPDGKTLVAILQSAATQDASGASANTTRLVTIDIATGATKEYAYTLTTGTGVSEIVAIDASTFLVDERDGRGLGDGTTARSKAVYRISLAGAAEVSNLSGAALAAAAVPKALVVDLVPFLAATAGLSPAQVPAKIEGLAFGEDVLLGGTLLHTLFVANDNDFVSSLAGPSTFYVLGVTDADLGAVLMNSVPAAAVPEPASAAVLGTGLLLLAGASRLGRRRRRG